MIIILAIVLLFGALVCYASCYAAARADKQSEEYFYFKMQEIDAERRNENLKNQ
jgi:hypothetical protein